MATNPDFDWDEVIVSKKPKQKEIEASFLSDPDIELGSRPDEEPEEVIVESLGLTECQQQSCGAAEAYQQVLAYDEMTRCYGVRDEFFNVDTPAAVRFRIASADNFPNQNVLDNYNTWNIRGNYDMVNSLTIARAPCETRYDYKLLDATFLNANPRGNVAFYPRAFENYAGHEMSAGERLTIRSIFGQMLWGRDQDGSYYQTPDPNRTGFGYLRLVATGRSSANGTFDGFNAGGFNMAMTQQVQSDPAGDLDSGVYLRSDSIDFFTTDGSGYPVQEAGNEVRLDDGTGDNFYSNPNGAYMPLGDQTGAYMCKLEMDIQMSQDGNTATCTLFMETEHVLTGLRTTQSYTSNALNLNGGLKLSSPWELWGGSYTVSYGPINAQGDTATYNTRGGMEGMTRYWAENNNVKRSMWLIAYDGWENESKVRKACWEMERSRPSWSPKDYCSRIQ